MQLVIQHQTRYALAALADYSIQQLRLTPQDGFGQRVKNWTLKVSGSMSRYRDAFGNTAHTLVMDTPHAEITITASGEVETDADIPPPVDHLSLPVFLRNTPLNRPDEAIRRFAQANLAPGMGVNKAVLAELMQAVHGRTRMEMPGETPRSAAQTFADEAGSSHDMAHLFIACCHALAVPARFVHGYRFDSVADRIESHGWADAWLIDHGWMSFDIANNCPSNGVHVRLATGLDYRDACPVSTVMNDAQERLSVSVKVQESTQAQQ
jgi:transglutaminase-like putative cysteine protease